MNIRPVEMSDRAEWLRLRCLLWPSEPAEHDREIAELCQQMPSTFITFVVDLGNDRLGGFVEANLRNYAEGCSGDRVAYVEGWYVEPALRRQGVGRRLVQAVEEWARQLGLSELASDCEIDNDISLQAHLALNFTEEARIICFRKRLEGC